MVNSSHVEIPERRILHRFALVIAAVTLLLLAVGGVVTSRGVGMAVPDWPNTYGYNMFFFPISEWVGGIFYEHSHRLLASALGMLTIVLALWLHGRRSRPIMRWGGAVLMALSLTISVWRPERWQDAVVLFVTGSVALVASFFFPSSPPAPRHLRVLGLLALGLVILQGVLGGLRVTESSNALGIFHGTLAQLFLVLVCSIALLTSDWWQKTRPRPTETTGPAPESRAARYLFLAATLLVLAQLILGATMRHQHAGLAIPDFPLAYGKLWPATDPASVALYNQQRPEVTGISPITGRQIVLQMVHRIMAFAILAAVGACAWSALRRLGGKHPISAASVGWFALIVVQVGLGAATVWSNKAADIATAHMLAGALSLATGALLCLVSWRGLVALTSAHVSGQPEGVPGFTGPKSATA